MDKPLTTENNTRVDDNILARECIMVALSSNPLSSRLVRAGYRMVQQLDADFIAVHIESPTQEITDEQQQINETIQLATSLGARVITVTGKSISDTLLQVAKENGVTKLIIGQTLRTRWQEVLGGSIINRLIRMSGEIDIYVISSTRDEPQETVIANSRVKLDWQTYLAGLGIVGIATAIGFLIDALFSLNPTNLVMIYLLAIVIASVRYGYGVAALISFLSVVIFNVAFVPPRYTFQVADAEYIITFIGLGGVGLVTAYLASQVQHLAVSAQNREQQTARLYAFSQDLATATHIDDIFTTLLKHIQQVLECKVVIFLPQDKILVQQASSPDYQISDLERTTANWVYDHGQQAGRNTNNLADARGFYRPLKIANQILGVIGIQSEAVFLPDQERLLDAFVSQFSLALEAIQLLEKSQEAELISAKEKLQRTILNSVSHDLRTPLVSVKGALSSLLDKDHTLTPAMQDDLLQGAYQEADRLNRLVGNLLEMSRLQSGALNLKREPYAVEEIISVARTQLESRLIGRDVTVDVQAGLPLLKVDVVLFSQVIVNLLDNAAKYSEADTVITIGVFTTDKYFIIDIMDEGIGIPETELPQIFDNFFRASSGNQVDGSGLGLSIVRSIVELHKGSVLIKNRAKAGIIFSIRMPLTETLTIDRPNRSFDD